MLRGFLAPVALHLLGLTHQGSLVHSLSVVSEGFLGAVGNPEGEFRGLVVEIERLSSMTADKVESEVGHVVDGDGRTFGEASKNRAEDLGFGHIWGNDFHPSTIYASPQPSFNRTRLLRRITDSLG